VRRRDARQRPEMPAWVIEPTTEAERAQAHEWATSNGYTAVEWLIARADARRLPDMEE
jgi:FAD/FMN-containing dehydrogenase